MNVGSFRHDVAVMEPVAEAVDEYGRRTVSYERRCMVKAAVSDVSGRKFYEAAAHQLQNTVTFTTRWIFGISPAWKLVFQGITYQIDQINHLRYKRDFIRIKAHAVEPEGAVPYGENPG